MANIPHDKLLHFFYGSVLLFVVALFTNEYIGAITLLITAVGKEVRDKVSGKGTPDVWDAVATIIPTLWLLLC